MKLCGVLVVEDRPAGAGSALSGRLEALEHVANRPIAHHVIDGLEAAGVDEMIVVTSEDTAIDVQECLATGGRDESLRIRLVAHPGPVNLSGALPIVAPLIGSAPCVLHTASGLLGDSLASSVTRLRAEAPDAVAFVHQGAAMDRHLSQATREMLHLAELDPQNAALGIAGVWLFGPEALAVAAGTGWGCAPDIDLTEIASRIANAGGTFDVLAVDTWRSYDGDPLDLLELNRIALDRLQPNLSRPQRQGNQIEGRVHIHERAFVDSSVIVGPTVIGPGARVADAYLGPYTSVGANARIEGAEVERSIISSGASILHVGGRIVASVIGRDARVLRDFSLPRALRLRVGDHTEVVLC